MHKNGVKCPKITSFRGINTKFFAGGREPSGGEMIEICNTYIVLSDILCSAEYLKLMITEIRVRKWGSWKELRLWLMEI